MTQWYSICGLITASIVTFLSIPIIIRVCYGLNLLDIPGGRKIHKCQTPNLGGVALYVSFFFSMLAWGDFQITRTLQYFLLGLSVLFFVGLKDDVVPISPMKKMGGQVMGAFLLVVLAGFKIDDLHGLFGIHHLVSPFSEIISIFLVVAIINAFNLIDGIDGLAGGIALIIALTYGAIFYAKGMQNMHIAAFILSGALIGFLYYNTHPAKIFMGDTGSMTIGYIVAAFTLRFLNCKLDLPSGETFQPNPAIAAAILVIPFFDTLRVIIFRLLHKSSPFKADRNHIHHILLGCGMNDFQASVILYVVNILFIGLAYWLRHTNPNLLMGVIIILAAILTSVAVYLRNLQTFPSLLFSQPQPSTPLQDKNLPIANAYMPTDVIESISVDKLEKNT
ncbi:UDP-N-acetylmuramyl pentapeptide phosphotransferase/UDP-N-acetylglucosamine-1-phosphate transferase [Thermoflavifilum thermophilum]|uniref:UDP-N-acetylmuramyl pentapeptide phosphotransferase/UDP-N-acetylglucosamine-1-phosphate transferase n=2 Tax=Thermoflavifilum thermophilum TaxID=1393122 RepID=A0A1I7NMD8_9BACT|nr:UDP-N-acetylmuramyl pentapeptide phosphotransferase/UDP-N-acetylglucosamine-1-phosphate transferase [Thermoflavifilum thermophilum]